MTCTLCFAAGVAVTLAWVFALSCWLERRMERDDKKDVGK